MSAAFLAIPSFPGHRAGPLAVASGPGDASDPAEVVAALRAARVGGCYWGAAADLPARIGTILAPDDEAQAAQMLSGLDPASVAAVAPAAWRLPETVLRLPPASDPWTLAESGRAIVAGADEPLALVATLAGAGPAIAGGGRFAGCAAGEDALPGVIADRLLAGTTYLSPFTGEPVGALGVIAQLAEWRALVEANRAVVAVCGVAGWKRVTADALLWDGTGPVRHVRLRPPRPGPGGLVLAWKSRTAPSLLAQIEASGAAVGEIEDGMIRSVGLGANCVPPLSVIVDRQGIYFDPARPSELEDILEHGKIGADACRRAAALRATLVAQAISKYGRETGVVRPRTAGKRLVLVAGQVADDRSMLSGGGDVTNLDLIRRARELEKDAHIVYKPHPDVEAGHRKGRIADEEVLRHADEVVRDTPITTLLDAADAVHVITSLAGFEGLLRGKSVTTHGVPFYAGWGLTRDMGAVPPRRTRRRSLDELVAATLLIYPRYLDPVSRLPCPAEVLVARIAAGEAEVTSPLVALRTWQGRANRALARLAGSRR
ncbi:MAG: beta-3-deoxy-D-manno-oct-2-ulosonic acid transferase [Sphingomonadales bacterium]|nr:beta-3-deoxy-D-manno-oct-2-ulosonic acid transferase [Sphingomonadales bacterium]MDE2570632.1 beta-3-deoxy-D-manno-oct-2-ulosonic acid transferase [Sphingomonadales bacterium]